jgi:lysophospholipase L1-like esterase
MGSYPRDALGLLKVQVPRMPSKKTYIAIGLTSSVFLLLVYLLMKSILPGEQDVLCLGDSYTIGESVEEKHRWPNQLVVQLQDRGVQWNQPRIIAKTGWTTDELQSAISQSPFIGHTYGWVTLLIGVNNQYRGRDAEVFRKDFRELLQYAIERANNRPSRVLVLSIPDWGVTPFAQNRDTKKIAFEIDAFNRIKREETLAQHAHFIDITDISREAPEDPSKWLAPDELHPSGAMYQRWAQRAADVVLQEIKKAAEL